MSALADLIDRQGVIAAPGVFDGLSARLARDADAAALYLSGYAVSASLLGRPDAGFLTAADMIGRIRMIAGEVALPLIADADTGFGGPAQVAATVRDYAAAGAAAIQLEDQVFPKRCGHTRGREVLPLEEAAKKIEVAVAAKGDAPISIIARTDARTGHGLDEAIRRGKAFHDAGADIIFIESPESVDELKAITAAFQGAPVLANMVEGGRTPYLPPPEVKALGFQIAIYPLAGMSAAAHALRAAYGALAGNGDPPPGMGFDALNRAVGFEDIRALDKQLER